MRKLRLVTSLIICCIGVSAQILPTTAAKSNTEPPKDPLNRDTPQSSVESFLEAVHNKDYSKAVRYIDLRSLPQNERLDAGTQLARDLERILDSDTQFDVASLSREPTGDRSDNLQPNRERIDTFHVNGQTLELDLERVQLRSGTQVWVFASDSLQTIPAIAQATNSSAIVRHLPLPLVNIELFGTPLWRWIGMALLAFALAALSKLLSRLALWLIQHALKRFAHSSNFVAFQTFIGPLRLLLSVALFRAGMDWFAPSALLRLYLERFLALLFFCGIFWLCSVIIDAVTRHLLTHLEGRHRSFSYSVLPLAGRITKIVVLIFIIAAVLSAWGYNTTTLLAGLGIGGVAIALASQKTIENLFGSVSVISDRPVSVGDFCKFGSSMGTVEDIGLRSTRVRTLDRTLVTVPNGSFSAMTIENFNRKDKNLFHVTLNLKRDTTPDQMREVLTSITALLKNQPKFEIGAVPVRFIGIGAYSLDIEIFVYILTLDNDEFLRMQQDLLLSMMDTVHAAGTALAIPTQATVMYPVAGPVPNGNGAALPEALPISKQ